MKPVALHYMTILEIAGEIRSRRVSSREVTEYILKRIERYNPRLNAYVTITADRAMEAAARADAELAAGIDRGLLHGVPVAVKDVFFTKDVPTSSGMPILRDWMAPFDATVVTRLQDAGAVLLGKTLPTEAATFAHHPDFARPENPWCPDAWTGISSSGSGVATAAGLCFASMASDTGGSIRFPCAAGGLTGLVPTWGRVSRYGLFPLVQSFDAAGPIARSVADVAAMFGAVAGKDILDPTTVGSEVPDCLRALGQGAPLSSLRIGLDHRLAGLDADPEIEAFLGEAMATLEALGASVVEIELPRLDDLGSIMKAHTDAHIAANHLPYFSTGPENYGRALRRRIEDSGHINAVDVARATVELATIKGRFRQLFDEVDLIFAPVWTQPTPAWKDLSDDWPDAMSWLGRFGRIFNYAGGPALTLPCGVLKRGLPVAFQLVAPPLAEEVLLHIGHAYQQVEPWHRMHPPAFT